MCDNFANCLNRGLHQITKSTAQILANALRAFGQIDATQNQRHMPFRHVSPFWHLSGMNSIRHSPEDADGDWQDKFLFKRLRHTVNRCLGVPNSIIRVIRVIRDSDRKNGKRLGQRTLDQTFAVNWIYSYGIRCVKLWLLFVGAGLLVRTKPLRRRGNLATMMSTVP